MKTDRTLKAALIGLLIHGAYALINGAVGFANGSWWLITLFAYYLILAVLRFSVLRIGQRDEDGSTEQFAKRFTGGVLLILALTLLGTTVLSFIEDKGVKFNKIVMIGIAAYTFFKITLSIINLVHSKRTPSPTVKMLRNISFAEALAAIFSLQRSMLLSFPGMTAEGRSLFNLLTGSGVCLAVFLLGINLIGGKKIDMAKSKLVKANEAVAAAVVGTYQKIETGVVGTYQKIEDKFVERWLTHDGETVEEAKERFRKR